MGKNKTTFLSKKGGFMAGICIFWVTSQIALLQDMRHLRAVA
jgi:hypothetical protein